MVVFGGDKNVSVERGNFLAPSFRMWVAVLMHYWWHGFIKERQLVVLNVDNLKLRVLATLQNIEYPLCHRRGFPPRPRTAYDDSNLQHVSLSLRRACAFVFGRSPHQDRCMALLSRFKARWDLFSEVSKPKTKS